MKFIDQSGNQYEVGYAKASHTAGTTDGAFVSAVTGKRIVPLAFRLHCGATATVATFNTKTGTAAGTAISEAFPLGANGGRSEPFCPVGHMQTESGAALTLTVGTGSTVVGGLVYIEEPE